jgi:tetratricopeptide (TPR) repeat protein
MYMGKNRVGEARSSAISALAGARSPMAASKALRVLGRLDAMDGDYAAALERLAVARRRATKISDGATRTEELANLSSQRARFLAVLGRDRDALRSYRGAARLALKAGSIDIFVNARIFGTDLLRSQGRHREGLAWLGEADLDNRLYMLPAVRPWHDFYLGLCAAALGRIEEGTKSLALASMAAREAGNPALSAWAEVCLAGHLRQIGRFEDAAQAAVLANALNEALKPEPWLCRFRVLFELAVARSRTDPELALQQLLELRTVFQDRLAEVTYLAAQVSLAEAHAGYRSGRLTLSQHLAATAATEFTTLGMRHQAIVAELVGSIAGSPNSREVLCRRAARNGYLYELDFLRGSRPEGEYELCLL